MCVGGGLGVCGGTQVCGVCVWVWVCGYEEVVHGLWRPSGGSSSSFMTVAWSTEDSRFVGGLCGCVCVGCL